MKRYFNESEESEIGGLLAMNHHLSMSHSMSYEQEENDEQDERDNNEHGGMANSEGSSS